MINAILSALFVFTAVMVSKKYPFLAGLLAVFPIKVATTLIATDFQRDVMTSMIFGQITVALILLTIFVWRFL